MQRLSILRRASPPFNFLQNPKNAEPFGRSHSLTGENPVGVSDWDDSNREFRSHKDKTYYNGPSHLSKGLCQNPIKGLRVIFTLSHSLAIRLPTLTRPSGLCRLVCLLLERRRPAFTGQIRQQRFSFKAVRARDVGYALGHAVSQFQGQPSAGA